MCNTCPIKRFKNPIIMSIKSCFSHVLVESPRRANHAYERDQSLQKVPHRQANDRYSQHRHRLRRLLDAREVIECANPT